MEPSLDPSLDLSLDFNADLDLDSELHDAPRDASLDTSLNPALDPLVLNPCRRSQLFRAAWATAPIRCGWSRGILWGGGVRLVIYE